MKKIKIGKRLIGDGEPCFIVAEVSANHQQKFDQAVAIIKAAAEAGADAVKLQTFTPDTITIDSDKKWFWVGGKDNPDIWKGKTFYDLYKDAYTPWEWHAELKDLAESRGMAFFSTPLDHTAVDFLERLKVPCYKIASYEATDIPLLKKVASTKKPVIISVGFATLEEIELSISTLKKYGAGDIVVLQCTTSYSDRPKAEATNLRTMADIRERFNVLSGFSDNMGGIEVPALAAAMGAVVIEKHIVVEHDSKILDDRFSLDKASFKKMIERIRWQEAVLGKVKYGPQTEAEKYNRQFRRSLFAVKDIKKGEKFTEENVRSIRPAYGLETKFFDAVLGKKASKDIERGTPLSWNLIEGKEPRS
ncbi:MAG: pseudaminic acid synthase [Candidatus Aenigmarchaeota archaeon]|nr:pseudaminic acid synthase [Candidatus Aenigmarchaeota archaeon]